MGGHGGLNILPQKRWNVYRRDNRLRVRRDEEQHRESQQHRRRQEERQRMSDVLILLKRKKAEALARHQRRRESIEEEIQSRDVRPGAAARGGVDDTSHAAWLRSLVDFSGVYRHWSPAGKSVCGYTSTRAGCGHLLVSHHSSESALADRGTRVHRLSNFSSGVAKLNSFLNVAGSSSWPSGCQQYTPVSGYRSTATTEVNDESAESFLDEQPTVVRVRLQTTADCFVSANVSERSGAASSSLSESVTSGAAHAEYISSAIGVETMSKLPNLGAVAVGQAGTYVEEARRKSFSTEIKQNSLPQEQHRVRGELRHVNFFEAEENEMRQLDIKRKKYLQDAGYTPDATSEFEREIRTFLEQVPWYYKPPSTSLAGKPRGDNPVYNIQISNGSLPYQSQQPLLQTAAISTKAALVKQHQTATSAEIPPEQDQLRENPADAARTDIHGRVPIHTESAMIAPTKGPTKNQEKMRRSQDVKRSGRGSHSARHERSETIKRKRRKERTKVNKKGSEDDVECLQVLLLVSDEEDTNATHSPALSATASPLSTKKGKCGKLEQVIL